MASSFVMDFTCREGRKNNFAKLFSLLTYNTKKPPLPPQHLPHQAKTGCFSPMKLLLRDAEGIRSLADFLILRFLFSLYLSFYDHFYFHEIYSFLYIPVSFTGFMSTTAELSSPVFRSNVCIGVLINGCESLEKNSSLAYIQHVMVLFTHTHTHTHTIV